MSNRGFSYNYKCWFEGIEIKFRGGTVVNTPNGSEAVISLFATKELWDLKPKTKVVIGVQNTIDFKWYLLFEGSFSKFADVETAQEGRMISLIARGVRADIRKVPTALAFDPIRNQLNIKNHYNKMGIFQTFCVKGVTPVGVTKGEEIMTYNNSGLLDVSTAIRMIAGTALGQGLKRNINGEYTYLKSFGNVISDKSNGATPGTFLDTIIRGLWLQSVGGTSAMAFLNKSLRIEKKFFTPINEAGYNFWKKQSAGINMASHLMGNAQFSSLESSIMRLAAVFSVKPYSCSTPSIIDVSKNSVAAKWVMDPLARQFLVDRQSAEFGDPYILSSELMLPNLEFTAPPNFNIFTPAYYDRKSTDYDLDLDVTRGVIRQTSFIESKGGSELGASSINFPNALFDMSKRGAVAKDSYGRKIPPMTIEERYKGVKCFFSSISLNILEDDARALISNDYTSDEAREAISGEIKEIEDEINNINSGGDVNNNMLKASGLTSEQVDGLKEQLKIRKQEKLKRRKQVNAKRKGNAANAAQRHSLIKFMNQKFKGRVSTCEMHFNPFAMCGFPGLIVGDYNNIDGKPGESIIGMVQQVKHQFYINPTDGDSTTTVVMSNSRLSTEPTDINETGVPLYMRPTRGKDAVIDISTLEYINKGYTVPEAKAPEKIVGDNKIYDTIHEESVRNYPYVKDLLTISIEDLKKGKLNKKYLDDSYTPNKISKFYTEVFGGLEKHFMIGNFKDDGELKYFAYDTIQEAVERLQDRKESLTTFDGSYKLINRNICTIDEYFIRILGCSVKVVKDKKSEYNKVEPDTKKARNRYYGQTTDWYESNKNEYTKMDNKDNLSSISESMPVTSLIKERADAVQAYIKSLDNTAKSER